MYISERNFKLWSYTVSHKSLILRSPLFSKDITEVGYDPALVNNIDIEFSGVEYLNMPSFFSGIKVEVLLDNIVNFEPYLQWPHDRVFKIIASEGIFHIIASSCVIGTSSWLGKDRISNPQLKYDLILGQL
ncbi:MAG: hypothetical protein V4581_07725 [Bacteroidota bacterium]